MTGRARACFARTVAKCGGSSPDLPLATYATMLIEGQGGAQDVPGAKIALAGCFEDITVTSLRERIDLPHAAGAPYDFCKDNGGTTITTDECTALAGKKTELDGEKLAKSTYARLPPAARPLYGKVAVAWTRFAVADAWLIHDTERGGTIRASAALRSQQMPTSTRHAPRCARPPRTMSSGR